MIKKIIKEFLSKNNLELSKDSVEFNKNGQWELKKMNIPSHWQWEKNGERPGQPINAFFPSQDNNAEHLENLFKTLNNQNTSPEQAKKTADMIKDHVRLQKPGHVDIGHLHSLVRSQNPDAEHRITDDDFTDIIQNSISGIDNLKDIHKHCGGEGAVKALLRANGANGQPHVDSPHAGNRGYKGKFHKNLKLRLEVMKAMNPDKSSLTQHGPNGQQSEYTFDHDWEKTPTNQTHEDNVDKTYSDMADNEKDGASRAHEEACVDRFMDRFKRHYNM